MDRYCLREFNNNETCEISDAFNIKMTTAAKSLWYNGVSEQLNAVIQNSVHRIMVDCKCNEEVTLVWTIAAINSITNNIGFSPNKLVLEYNPTLPNVFENDPPALVLMIALFSKLVKDNLQAINSERQELIGVKGEMQYFKKEVMHMYTLNAINCVTVMT